MLEVEVKIKTDIKTIAAKLENFEYKKGATVYELDTYFNGENVDLKLKDKALRIREHKDLDTNEATYIMNFKGPKIDDTTMTRLETEFAIPSFESGEIMLNGLGYNAVGKVEKTRIHYKQDDITCCLDKVTGLGEFLEIEIMAEETAYSEAVDRIEALLKELDLNMEDTLRTSYLCMLQEMLQ